MWLTLITLKNEVHFPLILLFIMQGTAVDLSLGPGAPCALAFCFLFFLTQANTQSSDRTEKNSTLVKPTYNKRSKLCLVKK